MPAKAIIPAPAGQLDHAQGMANVIARLQVSDKTKAEYLNWGRPFIAHLNKHGVGPDCLVSYHQLLARTANLSPATKKAHWTAAKIYAKALHRLGIILVDPSVDSVTGQPIKQPAKLSNNQRGFGPSGAELETIKAYLDSLGDDTNYERLRAVYAVMLGQGLRQAEVAALEVGDFDPANSRLLVMGKGRDQKESVQLRPLVSDRIKAWLKASGRRDGSLFEMSARAIRYQIKKLYQEAKIEGDYSTHGLRHAFATQLALAGASAYTITQELRHKSPTTSLIYVGRADTAERINSCQVFGDLV